MQKFATIFSPIFYESFLLNSQDEKFSLSRRESLVLSFATRYEVSKRGWIVGGDETCPFLKVFYFSLRQQTFGHPERRNRAAIECAASTTTGRPATYMVSTHDRNFPIATKLRFMEETDASRYTQRRLGPGNRRLLTKADARYLDVLYRCQLPLPTQGVPPNIAKHRQRLAS